MKKKLLIVLGIIIVLLSIHISFAQAQEGVIHYEDKVNMHRRLTGEREAMKAMIPEFRSSRQLLIFNASESLYKPVEEDESDGFAGEGMRMQIRVPQNETYLNPSESKVLMLQEFMGKKYLIADSIKVTPWKLANESKVVLGYDCKKATLYNESSKSTITAWYSDKLRPFLGPETFHSLPGAVLEIDINDGERKITATKVELRSLKKNELKMPVSGIKTTQEEYRKMMDEHMEKMRSQGGVIIRN